MTPDTLKALKAVAVPFAGRFIKQAPQGKSGDYVPHDIVNQKALAIFGFHTFEIVELIRGYVPAWEKDGKVRRLARENGVVGVRARLTVEIDGKTVSIIEVGSEDNPQLENDADNAKKAASDAYKRCWMRMGLGLHLWSGSDYELPAMLDHYQKAPDAS